MAAWLAVSEEKEVALLALPLAGGERLGAEVKGKRGCRERGKAGGEEKERGGERVGRREGWREGKENGGEGEGRERREREGAEGGEERRQDRGSFKYWLLRLRFPVLHPRASPGAVPTSTWRTNQTGGDCG